MCGGISLSWRVSNPSERIGVVILLHSASIGFYGKSKKPFKSKFSKKYRSVERMAI